MSRNQSFDPRKRAITQRNVDEIREVGGIIRDQLNLLRSIKEEEQDLDMTLDMIMQKIEELESLKRTTTKRIVLDANFLTQCYNSVVFASEQAKANLVTFGRLLLSQRLVKDPIPYVTINLQYDFITAWQICLQQHVKVLKQTRLSINISVIDSIMNISSIVDKYVTPASQYKEREYGSRALKMRNKKLYGDEPNYDTANNDEYTYET